MPRHKRLSSVYFLALVCGKANRAHKLLSPRLPLLAIPTRNTFIRYSNQTYTWQITFARNFVVWPDSFRVLDTFTQRNWS